MPREHELQRRTLAVACALAALALFFPANILPILEHGHLGTTREMTIWSGVVELIERDESVLAWIVFTASIAIPVLKILGVLVIAWMTGRTSSADDVTLDRAARFLETIGPWSMLDVFLLAIAISIVRFGDLSYVVPRVGVYAFAAVVVLTIIATQLLRGVTIARRSAS